MRTTLLALLIIIAQLLLHNVEAVSLSSKDGDYPYHDAMIAAGSFTSSGRLTWDDMRSVLNCSHGEDAVHLFEGQIPEIIDKSLRKAEHDDGRIIEYTNDKFSGIGDNYGASIKGVTLSCVVIRGGILGPEVGSAAYASNLVASGMQATPDDVDPHAYNLSSMMKADVMELPVGGYVFVPKLYCLGDLDKVYDFGVTLGGSQTIAGSGTAQINRPLSLGTREGILRSAVNRVTWLSLIANDTMVNLVRSAYDFPSPELLAVLEVFEEKSCRHVTEANGTFDELQECIELQTTASLASKGIETDKDHIDLSLHQMGSMIDMQDNWVDWKIRTQDLSDPSDYNDDFQQMWSQQILDRVKGGFPVTPFTFDPRLAMSEKTSPLLLGYQVNPFLSPEQVSETLVVPDSAKSDVATCVQQKMGDTTGERAAALFFPKALRRREKEHLGSPSPYVAEWSHYNGLIGVTAVTELYNTPYMVQNVSWKENGSDKTFDLLPGNLTERRLGLTHDWVMTTKWNDETHPLQRLLQAQRDSNVYSVASDAAVTIDNPCGKAASNADIFLFVIAMATAACGGVNAILYSVHQAFHWWVSFCWSRRIMAQQESLPHDRSNKHPSCWRRLIPTYDLVLVCIGMAAFAGLYLPVLLQLIAEYEVANFGTDAVAMEVNYAPTSSQFSDQPSHSVLVTFVYSQTGCDEARPELLLILFIVGLVLGVFINAPYIHRAVQAFQQYFCCRRDRTNSSVFHSEPKILKAVTFYDMRSTGGTVQDPTISNGNEIGMSTWDGDGRKTAGTQQQAITNNASEDSTSGEGATDTRDSNVGPTLDIDHEIGLPLTRHVTQ